MLHAYPDESHGISIYFPHPLVPEAYYKGNQMVFKNSRFARDTSWDEVIELFWEEVKKLKLNSTQGTSF